MTLDLGIEPGPHWWEACALTTLPPLHPCIPVLGYTIGRLVKPLQSGFNVTAAVLNMYCSVINLAENSVLIGACLKIAQCINHVMTLTQYVV